MMNKGRVISLVSEIDEFLKSKTFIRNTDIEKIVTFQHCKDHQVFHFGITELDLTTQWLLNEIRAWLNSPTRF